jgi:hypothetical protein
LRIKNQPVKRTAEEIEREEPTHLKSLDGDLVPVPAMPGSEHFWRTWDWWMECRKIELGGNLNNLAWQK